MDPGPGTSYLISGSGSDDGFLASYDSTGDLNWAISILGTNNLFFNGMVIDSSGDIYVTGTILGTFDFDPGPGTQFVSSVNGYDFVVAKYSSTGLFNWVKLYEGDYDCENGGITIGQNGNIFVTGNTQGNLDFDEGPSTSPNNQTGPAMFLLELTPSGNYVDVVVNSTNNDKYPDAVIQFPNGDFFIAGQVSGTTQFDPAGGGTTYNTGIGSAFIVRYDSNKNFKDV